jgi:hypothetical protein
MLLLFVLTVTPSLLSMDKYPPVNPTATLSEFLLKLSAKTNALFTVEDFDDPSVRAVKVANVDLSAISADWDAKTAVEMYFPDYEVTYDPARQQILHVKHRYLITLNRYPVESVVDIEFDGSSDKYIAALGKAAPGLFQFAHGLKEGSSHFTPISVWINQLGIRNFLSVPLDLETSNGIVWRASTSVAGGKATTGATYTSGARFERTEAPVPLPFGAALKPDLTDGPLRKCKLSGAATLTPPPYAKEGMHWECWFTAADADRTLTIDPAILLPSAGTFSRAITIPTGKRCIIVLKYDGAAWMLTTQLGMY